MDWAIARGGEDVRRAVAATFARATSIGGFAPAQLPADAAAEWRAHGRLTAAELEAVARGALRDIVEPCAAALASKSHQRAA